MTRLLLALAGLLVLTAGCSDVSSTVEAQAPTPPAATTFARSPAQPRTSGKYFLLQDLAAYVPQGFDTLGYAQSVCVQMRQGDTLK